MKSIERKIAPVSEYFIYAPSKTAQKLYFYPLQCGMFTYEEGYSLSRRAFDSFLLMYIQKGTMELDFGGKTQIVPEKTFVLVDCYQPHGYSTTSGYECLWMHFDGPLAREYYQLITARLGNAFSMEDPAPVLQKMAAILKVFYGSAGIREPLLSKYFTDIFTLLLLYNPQNSRLHGHADQAERAITYINEHFAEDLTIQQLAVMAGMSAYHFIRMFRQETGYTPHEYMISRRMASARYLLKYTGLTTKEICYSTGFSSESVFCNAFKKQHGMAPQDYRKRGAAEAGSSL